MIINRKFQMFSTIISLETHVIAERFCRYQCRASIAKQVYLNTLAVSTVNLYLNSIGWSTNLEDSDSWNPVLQTMMNVADLLIPSYGKLECRFVLKGDNTVTVPPEVWSERIGYVVVELDKSLRSATVLGFARRITQVILPLTSLESLADFPAYLSQQKRAEVTQPPTLNKWFNDERDLNWHQLEELLGSTSALNFRSPLNLANKTQNRLSSEVQGVKLIHFTQSNNIAIALILNIRSKSKQYFDISLTVCNSQTSQFLPKGLETIILDKDSFPVMIAQASETETIEFCFSGKLGEFFSIELALDEEIIVESFII